MMTDVSATRGNNRQSSSCVVAVMELCVIGVLVAVNTAVWDDVYNRLQTANNTGRAQTPAEYRPRVPRLATDADPA